MGVNFDMYRSETYYVKEGAGSKASYCAKLKPIVGLYDDATILATDGFGEYPFLAAPPLQNVQSFNLKHAFDKIVSFYKETHTGIDFGTCATGSRSSWVCDRYNLYPSARLYVSDDNIIFSIGISWIENIYIAFTLDPSSIRSGNFVVKSNSKEAEVFKHCFRSTVSPLLLQMWGISLAASKQYSNVYIDEVILFPFAMDSFHGIGPNISDTLMYRATKDKTWILGDNKPSCRYLIMTE